MAHTLVFHFIKVSKRLQNALGLKSGQYELSPSEASALLIIDSQKDTSQINIALSLHLKPASIVSLIDELEKLKLVKRQSSTSDRRKYLITLTEEGKKEVKFIKGRISRTEESIKNKLTANEIKILFRALEKLSDNFDVKAENPNPNKNLMKGGEA